jgi:hypothetical protein
MTEHIGIRKPLQLLLDRSADVNAMDQVSLCEIEREGGIMVGAYRRDGKGAKGSVKALALFFVTFWVILVFHS